MKAERNSKGRISPHPYEMLAVRGGRCATHQFCGRNGEQKLYFVFGTKGTTDLYGLTTPERQKIHCGKAHFDSLDDDAIFSELSAKFKKSIKSLLLVHYFIAINQTQEEGY